MNNELFDEYTKYLVNPPPFLRPSFSDFENFYSSYKAKSKLLILLKDYCKKMRKEGLTPSYIVVGGNFLRKDEDSGELKLIICFPNGNTDRKAISEHCSPLGKQAKAYKGSILPMGSVVINNGSNDELSSISSIENLQKNHSLENTFHKVGLICLNFNEVIS